MRELRALLATLVLLGWISAGSVASAGAPARAESEGLSPGERAALVAGRLVMRPRTERRGSLRLFGGTSFQLVNVTADRVYGALEDPNSLWRMLPSGRGSLRASRRMRMNCAGSGSMSTPPMSGSSATTGRRR